MNKVLLFFIPFIFLAQTDNKHKTLIINVVPFEKLNGTAKRIVKATHMHFDGVTLKSDTMLVDTTYFDKNGIPTEIHRDHKGKKNQVVKYLTKLGKKGERIETRLILPEGQTIYNYNTNGDVIKSWFEDTNNNKSYQTSYKYDADGKMVQEDYFLSSKFGLQKVFFKYDSKNRLTESDLFSKDNDLEDKTLFEYMSFDKNSNWTKMIRKSTDKHSSSIDTITRKITYY